MQLTKPSPAPPPGQIRTLRLAWLTLGGFLLIFLLLLGLAAAAGYHFYQTATDPHEARLVLRGEPEWLAWQPAGRSVFQGVNDGQALDEGDAVRAAAAAGYGQVASISLFDQSQLDLWARAELQIQQLRTTRWTNQLQTVMLEQRGGYVRYDLRSDQPYQNTDFQVQIGAASVEMYPGGSYSIDLRQPAREVQVLSAGPAPALVADIAVRSGSAIVVGSNGDQVVVSAGQRVAVDPVGQPGLPVPARWELVRDGGFSQYSELEYNNTTLEPNINTPASEFWKVYGTPTLTPEQRGFFRIAEICRPPDVDNRCLFNERRNAAWFYRAGNQTIGFATGIEQRLGENGSGIDISEYRTLTFSMWARVLKQALVDGGERGTECPVMVRIVGRRFSPADPDQERVICLYVDNGDGSLRTRSDDIIYVPVELAEWYHLEIDLRAEDWLPDFRYLRLVQIYANGHDYNALVADVSLVGAQR
ncbi:MAG: hypothetical protein HC822_25080 [Oscillochloris sp.]|nr:hypothetical protein [Oscillochloris sp.]